MADVPPAWDGKGTDPWIDGETGGWWDLAAQLEELVFNIFWKIENKFLKKVAALFTEALDATVAFMPTQWWKTAMQEFLDVTLGDVYRQAYEYTNGWKRPPSRDARAYAEDRARDRYNQLVQFPDEVYGQLTSIITKNMNEGINPRQSAREVKKFLLSVDTPYWKNRAVSVARTETLGAMNGGRFDSQNDIAAELGGSWARQWVSTRDTRTRPTHIAANKQIAALGSVFTVGGFPLQFPGDPKGPAHEIIQCRCTTVLVEQETRQ